eukprot:GHRR01007310.1.p1 GENE.GHRR01007310.1~~GHRR01007310.1.p1  ORF type:complete len:230 (-),score=78.77 GHRR01007310.1:291-980(-)
MLDAVHRHHSTQWSLFGMSSSTEAACVVQDLCCHRLCVAGTIPLCHSAGHLSSVCTELVAHIVLLQDVAERHALLEHSRLLAALSIGMTLREEEQHTAQLAASRQQQQQQTQEQQQTHEQNAPSAMPVDDQQLVLWDDAAGDADDHEFGELGDSDYSAQESLTDETDWDDGDNSSESDASEGQRQRRSERQRQRQRRQAAAAVAGDRPLRSRLRGRHTAEDGVRHRSDM